MNQLLYVIRRSEEINESFVEMLKFPHIVYRMLRNLELNKHLMKSLQEKKYFHQNPTTWALQLESNVSVNVRL